MAALGTAALTPENLGPAWASSTVSLGEPDQRGQLGESEWQMVLVALHPTDVPVGWSATGTSVGATHLTGRRPRKDLSAAAPGRESGKVAVNC